MDISDSDRLQLQKMIDSNEAQDNTDTIRHLKHSEKIRVDIQAFDALKKKHQRIFETDFMQFKEIATRHCSFLYCSYTDIFNKLVKDELNVNIFNQFLDVLQQVENGEVDQHEGSVVVGELLKKIYIDSALKRAEKLDKAAAEAKDDQTGSKPVKHVKDVSWKQYKIDSCV